MKKIIKSCKATNLEFLKLEEKLGLCLYDEQEFIASSEEIFTQHDVENNQLKEENEQLKKENEQLRKENEQLRKNSIVKDASIKESIEIQGKGIVRAGTGNKKRKGIVRADIGKQWNL